MPGRAPHEVAGPTEVRVIDDGAGALRSRRLRVTTQRLAVLRAVAELWHPTAEQVHGRVCDEVGAVSRQTVYDALATLADESLIRRIQPAGSPARFEARVGDNHHHLICRQCGRTVDVDCAVGETPCLTAADGAGFEIDEAEVVYWGRCPDCVAAGDGPPPDLPPDSSPTTQPKSMEDRHA